MSGGPMPVASESAGQALDSLAERTAFGGVAARSGRIARVPPVSILVALLTGFALPNLAWAFLDRRVWAWDQAWYGEVTADLFFLSGHTPDRWLSGMLSLMPSKPPLLAWLGQAVVPIGAAAGNIDVALLMFMVVLQTLSLAMIWAASRAVAPLNLPAAIATTSFAASGPLFIGLSHQYLVEPLQILDVSASLLLAVRAPTMAGFRSLAFLALVVVVGLASKTTSFIYCGLFWAMVFAHGLRAARQGRWVWRDRLAWMALAAALLLGSLTVAWYVSNMDDLLAHIRAATAGPDAELYGHAGSIMAKLPFWFEAVLIGYFVDWDRWASIFMPVAMTASAIVLFWRLWNRRLQFEDAVALAAALHVVITFLLIASQPNEETRFIVPLVPDFAVLLAWGLRAPALRFVGSVTAVAFLAQLASVTAQSLGWPVGSATSAWLLPFNPDRSDRVTIHDLVLATCPASAMDRINVVGPEYPYLNANSMAFFAAKERLKSGYRCYYTGMGYTETDVGRALARVRDMETHDVVLPQPSSLPAHPDVFNMALVGMQAAIASSPDFKKTGQVGDYEVYEQRDPQ